MGLTAEQNGNLIRKSRETKYLKPAMTHRVPVNLCLCGLFLHTTIEIWKKLSKAKTSDRVNPLCVRFGAMLCQTVVITYPRNIRKQTVKRIMCSVVKINGSRGSVVENIKLKVNKQCMKNTQAKKHILSSFCRAKLCRTFESNRAHVKT